MNDALIVLNIRQIPAVTAAFYELPLDKIWLTGYSEKELAAGVFANAIETHRYDRYFVTSDDIIIRPHAFKAVRRLLDEGHPVATGYSQRTYTEWVVNVCQLPLNGDHPNAEAYEFLNVEDVMSWHAPSLPSFFAGFSCTGMSRELWERFPFQCFTSADPEDRGYASDFALSRRLQEAGVPIVVAREGFMLHMRHEWRNTNHPLDAHLLDLPKHVRVSS